MEGMKLLARICIALIFLASAAGAQPVWQSGFDSDIRFYQTTDFGILVVGTERSVYGIDGKTGQGLWRRGHRGLDETSVTPVPATDLVLFTLDEGKRSRLEAVDLLTGATLWRSDRVKGDVMQLAVEPERDLLAVVMVKKAFGRAGRELKREPVVHVMRLSDGDELWKHQLRSDVEMMPARFDGGEREVAHTLDNYRPPLMLDGRLYLFYEGVTSYDAETGGKRQREEFTINEDALALTDADPVFDEKHIYVSGRGKVRAIDRRTGEVVWRADDLGVTPELAVIGGVVYVRTGGQFTSIRDGEIKKHGPYGVSALDARTGERRWRYKGADKGLTNFVFADERTILIADRDDLISVDARTGERIRKSDHEVKDAQFLLLNERGEAVVGGREMLSAFRLADMRTDEGKLRPVWTARHKPPARGLFRIMAGIALRAAALYFRYGGLATSALNLVRGADVARSALSFRWSGLKSRFGTFDLTTLASNAGRDQISDGIRVFGLAARNPDLFGRVRGLRLIAPGRIVGGAARRAAPSGSDVRESLLEKLDPVRQIERLSDYFLRRQRLAAYRGSFMYFYTDLPEPFDRKGFVGVNIHTGRDARFILAGEPDPRFTTDEINELLYTADGKRLKAYDILD